MRITLTTARRPLTLLAAVASLALTLTACGSSDDSSTGAAPTSSADSTATATAEGPGVTAAHNDADVTFITDMAPHHSGAVAMAQLAAGQAGSAQVKDLATRIAAAQDPEIEKMKAMAKAWNVTLDTDVPSMTGASGGMAHMGGDDVQALMPMTGAAFDREFLTRMTAHHESAIEMAKVELANGTNPQAKELATSIVAAQQKEIAEMGELMQRV